MKTALALTVAALWLGPLAPGAEHTDPKPPKLVPAEHAVDQEANKKIKETLKNRRVSFDFVEVPIADAMDFMRQLVGLNLVLAPDVDRGAALTLKGNDMAVGNALEWMARLADAKVEVKDGAVVIQRGADAERGPKPKDAREWLKLEFPKLRKLTGAPVGKAVIPLGDGAAVEINLEEEDLDPETRAALLKLFRAQLLKELEKRDPQAAAELREAAERRAKLEADHRARPGALDDARRAAEEFRDRLRDKLHDKFQKPLKPDRPEGEEPKAQF